MKVLSKYMYGGKNTYKKGGVYVPQTQMSDEELSEKAYGKSKGPQRFTRKDVKPQTQMTNEELSKLASGTKQSEISTKPTTKDNNNKNNNQKDNKEDDKKGDKIYNLKNDKKWEYKITDGKWFARKKGTEKWHDISNSKDAVDKLDGEHPNARGQNMKHGGTLMSKYAKAYEEGGTPDGLANSLKIYKERYGNLPSSGKPMNAEQFIEIASRGRGKKWSKLLEKMHIDFSSPKDFKNKAKNNELVQEALSAYLGYMKDTKDYHKRLVDKGVAGDDIGMYQEYFNEGDFKTFNNEFISEVGQKNQELRNQILEKEKNGHPLSEEERWLIGYSENIDYNQDGEWTWQDEEVDAETKRKMDLEYEKKMANHWNSQGLNYKTRDDGVQILDYGGAETKPPVKTESNITTAPIVSNPSPTDADGAGADADADGAGAGAGADADADGADGAGVDADADGAGADADGADADADGADGADGEQINTEEKPPVVEETRAQKRKRLRKEWYESQSTPASMQGEKEDPSDSNVGGGTGGDTGGGTPPDTGGGTPPDTGGGTPPADDFSGTNPHPRRSEEWFEWNKRKKAAMHAKHGAITKKINYLKGGMYGKRTFRR